MPHAHFTPWTLTLRPCWHCRAFAGLAHGASVAHCSLAGGPRVRSQPEQGCSAFERETGADDEAAPPPDRLPARLVDVPSRLHV